MKSFKILAFTHKNNDLKDIGCYHIQDNELESRLKHLKNKACLNELMYLSTCNRVEFLIVNETDITSDFLTTFFKAFNPEWDTKYLDKAIANVELYEKEEALRHLFKVASSLDSLVVGEREIITQVRNAYEYCHKLLLTGDLIRLILKKTIETAKEVYTDTQIACKPVSIVSLANRMLKELNVKPDARFLIIGAGVTNINMAKYLRKHTFKNFVVFNRTLTNAQKLADELKGAAYPLDELNNYSGGFDVIVTCTSSSDYIINPKLYSRLVGNDTSKKIIEQIMAKSKTSKTPVEVGVEEPAVGKE